MGRATRGGGNGDGEVRGKTFFLQGQAILQSSAVHVASKRVNLCGVYQGALDCTWLSFLKNFLYGNDGNLTPPGRIPHAPHPTPRPRPEWAQE